MDLYLPETTNEEILRANERRWQKFCLDPRVWENKTLLKKSFEVQWKEVEFKEDNRNKVPAKQGIYMFVAKPRKDDLIHPYHTYILYVGQAHNLNERFQTYFRYKNNTEPHDQLKRIMIVIWEKYLSFCYFVTNDLDRKRLDMLEYDLIDTIIPPMNNRFRAKVIKQQVKLYAPR
jgi:excinuclease UvrABC nuclease subunit